MKRLILLLPALLLAGTIGARPLRQPDTPAPEIPVSEADEPMQTGRFAPEWASLRQYEAPEWFRNAKFGIWAHWGPQCVEGSGDWMARAMYQEGSGPYRHHTEHYGHPSEVGFKDILPLFRAERWEPDSLVAYYKSVGARYFFAMGNHHDNFDLWDSRYQPWNSVRIGPQRDILREWAAAARKQGLPFGVSLHADHAWIWYEPARRYDLHGPKIGIPYDGLLTADDGAGTWWEGLDPQLLYRQHHQPSKGSWADGMIQTQWEWGDGAALPSQEFITNVYNRTLDVINRYAPDLLYFDATVLPFYPVSDAGRKIAAHFYNRSLAAHDGRLEAVMLGKLLDESQREAMVWDVERGAPRTIQPQPWQTCTCLGNWHYNDDFYANDRYKSAATVVRLLADVVSKNGNLLLSVPLRADGTFDEKEFAILEELKGWMQQNGEAIYDTRPWQTFGEGPLAAAADDAPESGEEAYAQATADEIRFTTKGGTLYAVALAWPESGRLTIRSLATTAAGTRKVKRVQLLGYGKVAFRQTAEGLEVTLPSPVNPIAPALRIE